MKISKLSLAPMYLALANSSAVYAQAQPGEWIPDTGVQGDLPSLIRRILDFAIGFAVVVCVVILIFAGYQYMTANGDENKIQTATKSLTWAIIGLIICFVAVILVRFVGGRFLGVDTGV